MSYRVDRPRQPGSLADFTSLSFKRNPRSTELTDRLSTDEKKEVDEVTIGRTERTYGTPRSVASSQRIAEKVQKALESVREYRQLQLDLAEESSGLALSSRTGTLENARATYDTEIARIADTASFNGTNLITNGQLDLGFADISTGLAGSFMLGSPAAALTSEAGEMLTPTAALANKSAYEQSLKGLISFTAGTAAIVDRITDLTTPSEDPADTLPKGPVAPASPPPTAFAVTAALSLGTPYLDEQTDGRLVSQTQGVAPQQPNDSATGSSQVTTPPSSPRGSSPARR